MTRDLSTPSQPIPLYWHIEDLAAILAVQPESGLVAPCSVRGQQRVAVVGVVRGPAVAATERGR